MTMRCLSALVAFALAFASSLHASELLLQSKRVLFLGDSITYGGQYVDYIATYFATRYPDRVIEFLNLGLPSETVSGLSEEGHADGKFPRPDLHERLDRVMKTVEPDTVIACYGMNDGIYLPFSGERLAAFTNGLVRLRTRILPSARLILATPPVFDDSRGHKAGYGNTLDRYSKWMLAQRAVGWDVADLHGPMDLYLKERRKVDPGYFLAGDGVHPGDMGHWIMAKAVLEHLGANDIANLDSPDGMLAGRTNGPAILKLVQQKQRVLKDAWLTATGHKRPGMSKGLPLPEARVKATELDSQIRALLLEPRP